MIDGYSTLKNHWSQEFVTELANMLQDMILHSCNRLVRQTLGYNSAFSSVPLCSYGSKNAWRPEIMAEDAVVTRLLNVGFAIVDGAQGRVGID